MDSYGFNGKWISWFLVGWSNSSLTLSLSLSLAIKSLEGMNCRLAMLSLTCHSVAWTVSTQQNLQRVSKIIRVVSYALADWHVPHNPKEESNNCRGFSLGITQDTEVVVSHGHLRRKSPPGDKVPEAWTPSHHLPLGSVIEGRSVFFLRPGGRLGCSSAAKSHGLRLTCRGS